MKTYLTVFALVFAASQTGCSGEKSDPVSTESTEDKSVAVAEGGEEKIRQSLSAIEQISVSEVSSLDLAGFYEVKLEGGATLYMSEDGKHFFSGNLFSIEEGEVVNITAQAMNKEREQLLADIKLDDMIVYKPEGEVKGVITVFTDISCGYCRKLHQEVPEMNARGIEVRYLAYPRHGIGSPSYKNIVSAWCAEDPNDALTRAKAGENIPENLCNGNPVSDQFALGGKMGVRGTPAIVFNDGEINPGYLSADELSKKFGI